MSFSVLVKISKRQVSFWYQSGNAPSAPLVIKGTNEAGLYFYVDGNDFLFGNVARERFYLNDPNAYGNYFEIIKDPSRHFTIYGNQKQVKLLLYHGIEQCLSFFINTVLYKSESIESYRQHFPLRFIFDADIEDKERLLVESLFTEAGYENVQTLHFNPALLKVLVSDRVISSHAPVLLLFGIDNVLYYELYNPASNDAAATAKLEGHGADPVVKMLAEIIIEDVITRNPFLTVNKEKEVAHILPYAAGLLENVRPLITGEAEFTDGQKYYFKVRQANLNERMLYYSNDAVFDAIDQLLPECNCTADKLEIILGNREINTPFFSKKLLKRYSTAKGVSAIQFNAAIELLFSTISSQPAAPPVPNVPVKKPFLPRPAIPAKPPMPPIPPKKKD